MLLKIIENVLRKNLLKFKNLIGQKSVTCVKHPRVMWPQWDCNLMFNIEVNKSVLLHKNQLGRKAVICVEASSGSLDSSLINHDP